MPSPSESRAALELVTTEAVATAAVLAGRVSGSPEAQRLAMLDGIPAVIGYYSEGSAALAADFYEEQREVAEVTTRFTPSLVIDDRTVKVRRAVAWAAEPLFAPLAVTVASRLAEVVQLEVARAFRDTITGNRRADPLCVGWKRIVNNCCPFCRMLGDRGAVYKESSARFAAHPHCDCSAAPVFLGGDIGPEASAMQYMASKRSRTPTQRAELRNYLAEFYPA